MQIIQLFFEVVIQLLIIAPFALFAKNDIQPDSKKYLLVFGLVFLLCSIAVGYMNWYIFPGQHWNWFGKTASLGIALIFIYFGRVLTKQEAGWTWMVQNKRSVFTIVAAVLLIRLILRFILEGRFSGGYNAETFLYEATLPGIAEELIYRGIFLGLLTKVFMPRWILLHTNIGWALIITSVLFGLAHALSFNGFSLPAFNSQKFFMTGATGFIFGMVKEKGKSLWPAMLLHNLWNIIAYWGQ